MPSLISCKRLRGRMRDDMGSTELWTIGHSTRSIDEFIETLKTFRIQLLVDVRSRTSIAKIWQRLSLTRASNICIFPNLAAGAAPAPIRTIWLGATNLFAAMLITWRAKTFGRELCGCSISRARVGPRLCALRRFGGAAIAA